MICHILLNWYFSILLELNVPFNIVKIKQQQPKYTDVHVTQNFKEIAFYALSQKA